MATCRELDVEEMWIRYCSFLRGGCFYSSAGPGFWTFDGDAVVFSFLPSARSFSFVVPEGRLSVFFHPQSIHFLWVVHVIGASVL